MKKKILVPIFMLLLCLFVNAKDLTLVDNAGRTVVFKKPVEKAVVANRYNSELIRACGAIDKVIATDMGTAQDREYWANFDPKNVIGKGAKSLNYEKIVDLAPEVLILPKNGTYEEAAEKLAPFGIKVFVLSGYDTADFKNQVENIGKMFGTEKKAQKFYNYFNSKLNYIKKNIPEDKKKTLYLETTRNLASTVPGDYFYNMTVYGGAKNIFATDFKSIKKSEIDPEVVIERNPQVIIKLITPKTAIAGTGVYQAPEKEQFLETYNMMKERAGWEDIAAMKNDNVYFMTQFSHGGASKLVGAIFIAKWLYPDLLPDLDPEEVYRAWMEDFQGFKKVEGHFYNIKDLKNAK